LISTLFLEILGTLNLQHPVANQHLRRLLTTEACTGIVKTQPDQICRHITDPWFFDSQRAEQQTGGRPHQWALFDLDLTQRW